MTLRDLRFKLIDCLEDATLKQGLSEFLNKYTHRGMGNNTYDLADITRSANVDSVHRTLEYLLGEGFTITPKRITLDNEDSLKAINAIKALSLMQRIEGAEFQFSLDITPGKKLMGVADYPYYSFASDFFGMFDGIVPAVAETNQNKAILDFTIPQELNAGAYGYFTAVFNSLQKAIGVDSRPR